jgi:hypothetical protein
MSCLLRMRLALCEDCGVLEPEPVVALDMLLVGEEG